MTPRSIIKSETFTYLPVERVKEIERFAITAREAHKAGNKELHDAIIKSANESLTKHEKGLFCGFALSGLNIC